LPIWEIEHPVKGVGAPAQIEHLNGNARQGSCTVACRLSTKQLPHTFSAAGPETGSSKKESSDAESQQECADL